jgi:hypothetical protein
MASPNSVNFPPEVNAYYEAWRKAYKHQYGRSGDGYIEKAYEAWEIALIDCPREARRILGEMYQGVREFGKLPKPGDKHVKQSKKEIEASVLTHYKQNQDYYQV